MLARRSDYSHPLETLDREFGRMLNRFWGSAAEVPSTLAPYAVDVHEDSDHFYVDAELPGFKKEDVDITLEDGVLTLRAERRDEHPENGNQQNQQNPQNQQNQRQPLHIERRWVRFERSFTLPTAVNENSVKAHLDGGLLSITLDKREEVKPRKIQINATSGQSHNPKH